MEEEPRPPTPWYHYATDCPYLEHITYTPAFPEEVGMTKRERQRAGIPYAWTYLDPERDDPEHPYGDDFSKSLYVPGPRSRSV